MKNLSKQQAIKVIINSAQNYDTTLNGKHFLILYNTVRGIEYVKIGFRDYNFLHFTGIKTNLSAKVFYSACLNKRLSEKDIDLNTKGKAQQKLEVLPYLHKLLFNNCLIGNSLNSGIYIQTDYFVGNTKSFVSVGFRNNGNVDIPVTLYNENINKLTNPTYKVIAIFSKIYNEDKFNVCTYSNNFDMSQITDDIQKMLDLKI